MVPRYSRLWRYVAEHPFLTRIRSSDRLLPAATNVIVTVRVSPREAEFVNSLAYLDSFDDDSGSLECHCDHRD